MQLLSQTTLLRLGLPIACTLSLAFSPLTLAQGNPLDPPKGGGEVIVDDGYETEDDYQFNKRYFDGDGLGLVIDHLNFETMAFNGRLMLNGQEYAYTAQHQENGDVVGEFIVDGKAYPFKGQENANNEIVFTTGQSTYTLRQVDAPGRFKDAVPTPGNEWESGGDVPTQQGGVDRQTLMNASELYNKGEYAKALQILEPLAQQGHVGANYVVGVSYAYGHSRQADPAKAMPYFQRAANGGHPGALHSVGVGYREGMGVQQDAKRGLDTILQAAKMGEVMAMGDYGLMLMNGVGTQMNMAEGLAWLQVSGEYGNQMATQMLQQFQQMPNFDKSALEQSKQLMPQIKSQLPTPAQQPPDYLLDFNWFEGQSAGGGGGTGGGGGSQNGGGGVDTQVLDDALDAVQAGDTQRTLQILRPLADRGHVGASFLVGALLAQGAEGQAQVEALRYIKQAADGGHAQGIYKRGQMLQQGFAGEKDFDAGMQLIYEAAMMGDVDAIADLGMYTVVGAGLEKNEVTGLAMLELAKKYDGASAVGYLEQLKSQNNFSQDTLTRAQNAVAGLEQQFKPERKGSLHAYNYFLSGGSTPNPEPPRPEPVNNTLAGTWTGQGSDYLPDGTPISFPVTLQISESNGQMTAVFNSVVQTPDEMGQMISINMDARFTGSASGNPIVLNTNEVTGSAQGQTFSMGASGLRLEPGLNGTMVCHLGNDADGWTRFECRRQGGGSGPVNPLEGGGGGGGIGGGGSGPVNPLDRGGY